jgi:hypothetical protein
VVVLVDEGSSNQYKSSGGNIELNCVNCVLLMEILQNVLQEFKLA